jgi:tRNA U34 5-carboxymethylaminomethyl modifying enzyme MnmG/GidA
VREVDALGGIMAEITDAVGIQFRLLNTSRGPAVWSPRAQCDKQAYRLKMREVLESQSNLKIKQAEVVELIVDVPGTACPVPGAADGPELGARYTVLGVKLRDGRTVGAQGRHHHDRHISEWADSLRRAAISRRTFGGTECGSTRRVSEKAWPARLPLKDGNAAAA